MTCATKPLFTSRRPSIASLDLGDDLIVCVSFNESEVRGHPLKALIDDYAEIYIGMEVGSEGLVLCGQRLRAVAAHAMAVAERFDAAVENTSRC
jgi:hypothetical protein